MSQCLECPVNVAHEPGNIRLRQVPSIVRLSGLAVRDLVLRLQVLGFTHCLGGAWHSGWKASQSRTDDHAGHSDKDDAEDQIFFILGSLLGSFSKGCLASLGDLTRDPNLENHPDDDASYLVCLL